MSGVRAQFYDGVSARRHEVRLSAVGDLLSVESELGEEAFVSRRSQLSDLAISERLGSAARIVRFPDGAFCEVRDHQAFAALLDAAGHHAGRVERWQLNRSMVVAAAVLTIAVLAAAYRWILPVAAEKIAEHTPPAVAHRISRMTLQGLDGIWLHPSKLDAERRKALSDEFAALSEGELARAPTLEFRSSPQIGPNAFALPDGSVVLLDELVALAKSDEEIEGVLEHELGHVRYRHGVRLLVQGSTLAAAMTVWFGDVSTLLATVPTALLHAHYSREFESQADGYAIELMQRRHLSPARLADLLERMVALQSAKSAPEKPAAAKPGSPQAAVSPKTAAVDKKNAKVGADKKALAPEAKAVPAPAPPPGPDDSSPSKKSAEAWSYLASHPATDERIRRLREAAR